ncbi:MAG TPA: alpha/beta hydrolase [Vicinamibacterales bacterium]|nr:alpha/beta hydrolase [Vicinamibacterales bacterium]
MATFVLVHGSTQNSRCWEQMAPLLRSRGHDVVTPELRKRAPEWGLDEYAARIAESFSASDAVVVGHSFAGALLPLVPRKRSCRALVFLAAAIPKPGKSLRDQVSEDGTMFSKGWLAAAPRWLDQSQYAGLAEEFLFHDCDPDTRAWAIGTIDPLDTSRLAVQPLPIGPQPAARVWSIVATEDRTLVPDWSRRMSRNVLGVEPFEIRAGHCPHVSQPAAVAEILDRVASEPD